MKRNRLPPIGLIAPNRLLTLFAEAIILLLPEIGVDPSVSEMMSASPTGRLINSRHMWA
jgi:hypothetical protein